MLIIYVIILAVMSLATYIAYGHDKKKSKKSSLNRTPEKTLLLMSFFFGAIGGLLAMYGFRHKTKHWYFVVINWGSLIIQLVLLYLCYRYFGLKGFALIK